MRSRLCIALLLIAAWVTPARAQDQRKAETGYIGGKTLTTEVDSCTTPEELSPKERRDRAAEHYDRGWTLYNQGDYEGAITEFVSAYCDSPNYEMHKNIGQSFERLADYEKAVAYFSRYILESPKNMVKDRERMSFRVQVLSNMPARIKVATVPAGATVTLTGETGVNARGTANQDKPLEVRKGTYEMKVELPGYEPVTESIEVKIGWPYSYYYRLEPKRGALRVTADPNTARIFVDDRLAGIGTYVEQLPIGKHKVTVEDTGRAAVTREFEISAGRTTDLRVELKKPPRSGRRELIVASTLLGGVYGGGAFATLFGEETLQASLGALVGFGLGFAGGYLGIPSSIRVGTSSYIIGAALVAAGEGAAIAAYFACDPERTESGGYNAHCNENVISGAALASGVGGVLVAATTANKLQFDAGDAAIINSGAIWGAISGALFVAVFDADPRLWAPLELLGINLGVVSGVLLARRMDVSRGHVALIDLSGLAGTVAGVALVDVLEPGSRSERLPHFALIGMTAGLITGTYLTRNMDEPKSVPMGKVKPQVGAAMDAAGRQTMTFGFAARF